MSEDKGCAPCPGLSARLPQGSGETSQLPCQTRGHSGILGWNPGVVEPKKPWLCPSVLDFHSSGFLQARAHNEDKAEISHIPLNVGLLLPVPDHRLFFSCPLRLPHTRLPVETPCINKSLPLECERPPYLLRKEGVSVNEKCAETSRVYVKGGGQVYITNPHRAHGPCPAPGAAVTPGCGKVPEWGY